MDTSTKQTVTIGALIFFIFLATAAVIFYNSRGYIQKETKTKTNEEGLNTVQDRQKILATDPTDPSHINNLKYLQAGLEKYFTEKRTYPKKLGELAPKYISIVPKYSSKKDYLYAYYPKEKPSAYHLGAPLGGRNAASPQAFSQDADFNSEKIKYINGFDGADPVYDLMGGK
ncbi:hypothetical protein HY250_02355 [Candidatus Azambacteria bacterium]|nr:hypothetical protein [Candidatus Azambacteria bacterium]